jgi:hypothetical protein
MQLQTGTVLVDPESGLKLMVVEPATGPNTGNRVRFGERTLKSEDTQPAGLDRKGMSLTCDPGMRG